MGRGCGGDGAAGDRLEAVDPLGDWVSSPLPAAGASPPWGPACAPAVVAISVDCGGAVRLNERVAERAARLWECRVDPLERSGRLRARRVERRGRQRGIGPLLDGWDSRLGDRQAHRGVETGSSAGPSRPTRAGLRIDIGSAPSGSQKQRGRSLRHAVARLTLFWRSRRAARLALRSQRAVQTSHGGVTHITRGVGHLGGGGDVQRRRILMGTPGSAAGERAAG